MDLLSFGAATYGAALCGGFLGKKIREEIKINKRNKITATNYVIKESSVIYIPVSFHLNIECSYVRFVGTHDDIEDIHLIGNTYYYKYCICTNVTKDELEYQMIYFNDDISIIKERADGSYIAYAGNKYVISKLGPMFI